MNITYVEQVISSHVRYELSYHTCGAGCLLTSYHNCGPGNLITRVVRVYTHSTLLYALLAARSFLLWTLGDIALQYCKVFTFFVKGVVDRCVLGIERLPVINNNAPC